MTGGDHSIPEVHRLLAVLAAGRRAAEIGTAYGGGAEAIASTAVSLVTVEIDPERASAARSRLSSRSHVEVLTGDWRSLLPARGPFEVVFVDGGGEETKTDVAILDLVVRGGLLVMDDLTPCRPGPDPVRELWATHPAVVSTEILTTPVTAALLIARRAL